MRKFLTGFLSLFFVCFLCGCSPNNKQEYLRIHIRANSNLTIDQNIKYKIKDEVVNFLTPKIVNATSFIEVENIVELVKVDIENLCNETLKNNGFCYTAKAKIANEFFPTRAYGEYVLESDFYDALIIELGEACGDNWWCVVYPPLCFLDAKQLDLSNVKYKSKLIEIINNFFD